MRRSWNSEKEILNCSSHSVPFMPRGYRTRPLNYERGMSGKQSATNYPENPSKPVVLLVMDSNGRNIVHPQRIYPSSNTSFDLAAISIPGGKTSHACTELHHLKKCDHTVSHVALALGTNDMFEGEQVLSRFSSRVKDLIRVAQDVYPSVDISYVSVLPRHDKFSGIISKANKQIRQVTQKLQLPFLSVFIPEDPFLWSDYIHLSDEGLRLYMRNFEAEVETKLFGNTNFKPAKVTPKFGRFSSSTSRQSQLRRHSLSTASFNVNRPSLEIDSVKLDCNKTLPTLGTSNRFSALSATTVNNSSGEDPVQTEATCSNSAIWETRHSLTASATSHRISTQWKDRPQDVAIVSPTFPVSSVKMESKKLMVHQKSSPRAPHDSDNFANAIRSSNFGNLGVNDTSPIGDSRGQSSKTVFHRKFSSLASMHSKDSSRSSDLEKEHKNETSFTCRSQIFQSLKTVSQRNFFPSASMHSKGSSRSSYLHKNETSFTCKSRTFQRRSSWAPSCGQNSDSPEFKFHSKKRRFSSQDVKEQIAPTRVNDIPQLSEVNIKYSRSKNDQYQDPADASSTSEAKRQKSKFDLTQVSAIQFGSVTDTCSTKVKFKLSRSKLTSSVPARKPQKP